MVDKLSAVGREMMQEKHYGTKYTHAFEDLDEISKTAACRYAQIERNDFYEKNWPEFFTAWRFHADGTRAF